MVLAVPAGMLASLPRTPRLWKGASAFVPFSQFRRPFGEGHVHGSTLSLTLDFYRHRRLRTGVSDPLSQTVARVGLAEGFAIVADNHVPFADAGAVGRRISAD